jgi:hypothetical protein
MNERTGKAPINSNNPANVSRGKSGEKLGQKNVNQPQIMQTSSS